MFKVPSKTFSRKVLKCLPPIFAWIFFGKSSWKLSGSYTWFWFTEPGLVTDISLLSSTHPHWHNFHCCGIQFPATHPPSQQRYSWSCIVILNEFWKAGNWYTFHLNLKSEIFNQILIFILNFQSPKKKSIPNSINLWLLQIQFNSIKLGLHPPVHHQWRSSHQLLKKMSWFQCWKLSSILNENCEWHCMQMAEGYMPYMLDARAQV